MSSSTGLPSLARVRHRRAAAPAPVRLVVPVSSGHRRPGTAGDMCGRPTSPPACRPHPAGRAARFPRPRRATPGPAGPVRRTRTRSGLTSARRAFNASASESRTALRGIAEAGRAALVRAGPPVAGLAGERDSRGDPNTVDEVEREHTPVQGLSPDAPIRWPDRCEFRWVAWDGVRAWLSVRPLVSGCSTEAFASRAGRYRGR